jgi:uridine phosphorylase
MVLERLIALGARQVWILSWCGSLQPQVRIGSLILPTWALNADGTSPHYLNGRERPAPHPGLAGVLTRRLQVLNGIPWHTGPIWTHDAIYRETASQVQHYQAQGILGVEMELAALFAVGQFRRVPVAGLLVVSDELFSLSYQHGYRQEHFREARELAARLLLAAATGGPHEI